MLKRTPQTNGGKNFHAIIALIDSEKGRSSMGLILSLVVIIAAVKLPWYSSEQAQGWRITTQRDQIEIMSEPEEIIEKQDIEGGIVTVFDNGIPEEEEAAQQGEEEVPVEEPGEDEDALPEAQKIERIDVNPILEFVDQSPTIVGGLSSLYLNIDYPKEARDEGIQGLTVLMFVVEKDGSTSNIEVMKSLHPACDSAAIAAVQETRFKPGVQDGSTVRVKMRLPVRFKLVERNERYVADSLRANPS